MSFNVKSCGLVISRETNSSIAGQTVQSIFWDEDLLMKGLIQLV